MGVRNLWDILDSCKKVLPLHHLQNKKVCIDLSCWIVQLQNVNKSHCPLKEKVYLKSLFHRLRALIALNCSLILVTDGSIPAIKLTTYRQRLNTGTGVTQDVNDKSKATSLKRNMGSEFSCMIKEAKLLGEALGIPCLDGIEEAEAQCALLNSESLCDGCFTSDSDVFLFGARTVYREICLGEGGYVVCYEMDDIESKLGFGRNSLISLGILLGSDYSPGVRGIGPENACRIVKSVGDRNILQKISLEGTLFLKNSKGSKKHGNIKSNVKEDDLDHEINVNGGDQNQAKNVMDAYLKPKCHSAESDAVLRVLGLYSFQRVKLQQTCAQFFDWPPEITDEYILPKIAERELRRFANLRITSSALGVQLPLDEMPVKCPLSGIVKRRKVSGQDCFEVSWEEMDGLKTSIVPANLVESACPEKIAEFEAERAEKKKPKPRKRTQKKPENNPPLEEIEQKLQNLLLDIERESAHKSYSPIKEAIIPNNSRNAVPKAADPRTETSIHSAASSTINSKSSSTTEVIDLLSPSPLKRGPVVSKHRQAEVKCMDIIDLSDTEIEVSPEHARKARDLRLFLASIRDDQF